MKKRLTTYREKLYQGGISLAGAGLLANEVAKDRGSEKGKKILKKIEELKRSIDLAESYTKDDRVGFGKIINKSTKKIKKLAKKNKKELSAVKLSRAGLATAAAGGGLIALGGGAYLINKIPKNNKKSDNTN